MDRLTKEQFHKQAEQIRDALAAAVRAAGANLPENPATSDIVDKALAMTAFYGIDGPSKGGPRNAVDIALEQFSAELISLMLTYAAGELPAGFDKLPRPF